MLSKKSQYSIYALVKLAKERDKGPILIRDIAESEKIPRKFLEAILLDLRNLGIIASKKGKGGGYYLIKDPAEIDLATIIRKFDGALALISCASKNYYEQCKHCKDERTCGVKNVFDDVRNETDRMLRSTSIADIISRDEELKKLL
ncbi:MAG: Rrf2 family transcriptional regulator [Bacteroidales bacterium]|nr:MAG: Rrf2 family transcriptional regulator [Bacteroidales bacterium]